eukprot:UN18451
MNQGGSNQRVDNPGNIPFVENSFGLEPHWFETTVKPRWFGSSYTNISETNLPNT